MKNTALRDLTTFSLVELYVQYSDLCETKVLKCGAEEGWRRSIGPIVCTMATCFMQSRRKGISSMFVDPCIIV